MPHIASIIFVVVTYLHFPSLALSRAGSMGPEYFRLSLAAPQVIMTVMQLSESIYHIIELL